MNQKLQVRHIISLIIIGVICILTPGVISGLQVILQHDTIIATYPDADTRDMFELHPSATQILKVKDDFAGYIRVGGENPILNHPEWVTGEKPLDTMYAHVTLSKTVLNIEDRTDYIIFTAELKLDDNPDSPNLPITYDWNIKLMHESGDYEDHFIAPFVNGYVQMKYASYDGQPGGNWYLSPITFEPIDFQLFVVLSTFPQWAPYLTEYAPYSEGKTPLDYSHYSYGKDVALSVDPDTYTLSSLGKDKRIELFTPVSFAVSRVLEVLPTPTPEPTPTP